MRTFLSEEGEKYIASLFVCLCEYLRDIYQSCKRASCVEIRTRPEPDILFNPKVKFTE